MAKKSKKKYYRTTNIDKFKAQYNVLLGERSNGKSYAVKEKVLIKAFNGESTFIYLRRYSEDIKTTYVERYFRDMPISEITDGEYEGVAYYRGDIFFCNYDDAGKVVKGILIGQVFALNEDERMKSQALPGTGDIIYEEFITRKIYLPEEPDRLMDVVSTIARDDDLTVWMIGNRINRVCPYFTEWQLVNIPTQEPGKIDTYTFTRYDEVLDEEYDTLIAVENCENLGSTSKMFFGKKAESITGAAWASKEMPKFPKPADDYTMLYEVMLIDCGFTFVIQLYVCNKTGGTFNYVYPYTRTRRIARKITNNFSPELLTSTSFNVKINAEKLMRNNIMERKVCYSDNLTGTDFEQVLMNRKGVL